MQTVVKLLEQLEAARFYGSIEIKLEAGHVTIIRKTESIKPSENHPNNGGYRREHFSR